jgi:hypothetical protein
MSVVSTTCVCCFDCRLFENICFLLGSAYFVSGSYPEEEGNGHEDVVDNDMEQGFYLKASLKQKTVNGNGEEEEVSALASINAKSLDAINNVKRSIAIVNPMMSVEERQRAAEQDNDTDDDEEDN